VFYSPCSLGQQLYWAVEPTILIFVLYTIRYGNSWEKPQWCSTNLRTLGVRNACLLYRELDEDCGTDPAPGWQLSLVRWGKHASMSRPGPQGDTQYEMPSRPQGTGSAESKQHGKSHIWYNGHTKHRALQNSHNLLLNIQWPVISWCNMTMHITVGTTERLDHSQFNTSRSAHNVKAIKSQNSLRPVLWLCHEIYSTLRQVKMLLWLPYLGCSLQPVWKYWVLSEWTPEADIM
jgi:hypothetical protein